MIGIDEAGRGAWAGPLVVAGCSFAENPGFIRGLNDSKKLTRKKREALESQIKSSTYFHVVVVPSARIDEVGLTQCLREAMIEIAVKLPHNQEIIIDGPYNFLKNTEFDVRVRCEVRADGSYVPVMAASILAKVERDRIMRGYVSEYPDYGFESHVGYGTIKHIQALKSFGATSVHRQSYRPIKELA